MPHKRPPSLSVTWRASSNSACALPRSIGGGVCAEAAKDASVSTAICAGRHSALRCRFASNIVVVSRGAKDRRRKSSKENEARRKIAPTQRPRISKFFQKAVVIIKLFLGPSALGSSASEFFQDRTRACQCIAIGNLHAA